MFPNYLRLSSSLILTSSFSLNNRHPFLFETTILNMMRPRLLLYVITMVLTVSSVSALFINEINVDGVTTQKAKTLEIAAVAGTNLAGCRIVIYNSIANRVKEDIPLTGIVPNHNNSWGFLSFRMSSIRLAKPIAVAFVSSEDHVIDFVSYGFTFTPKNGIAFGQSTIDLSSVGNNETSIVSAGRIGLGMEKGNFAWTLLMNSSYGFINEQQYFFTPSNLDTEWKRSLPLPFINEFHYNNFGKDVGEMVEIAFPCSVNIHGYQLVLYEGKNGAMYKSVSLNGEIDSSTDGWCFVAISFDSDEMSTDGYGLDVSDVSYGSEGLEILSLFNLRKAVTSKPIFSPSKPVSRERSNIIINNLKNKYGGIALIGADGETLEFISYGKSFIATDGPAKGIESTFTKVSESGYAPMETSIQRVGNGINGSSFTWIVAYEESFGSINSGQIFDVRFPEPSSTSYSPEFASNLDVLPFINEIQSKASYNGVHVEIAAQAGVDLSGYSLVLIDGSSGHLLDTVHLTGSMPWISDGIGFKCYVVGEGCLYPGDSFSVGLTTNLGKLVSFFESDRVVHELWAIGNTTIGLNGPHMNIRGIALNYSQGSTSEDLSFQRTGTHSFLMKSSWSSPLTPSYGWENEMQQIESVFCSERFTMSRNRNTSSRQEKKKIVLRGAPVSAIGLLN